MIYLHGNAGSRFEGIQLLEQLFPHGIALVVFDFSGCGISEGEYISLGYFEKDDASLVIDYVKKNFDVS